MTDTRMGAVRLLLLASLCAAAPLDKPEIANEDTEEDIVAKDKRVGKFHEDIQVDIVAKYNREDIFQFSFGDFDISNSPFAVIFGNVQVTGKDQASVSSKVKNDYQDQASVSSKVKNDYQDQASVSSKVKNDYQDQASVSSKVKNDYQDQASDSSKVNIEDQASVSSKVNIEDVAEHSYSFKAPDPCYESFAKEGPCEAYISSWSYNQGTEKCEHFIFGGCEGNNNRFLTFEECSERCEDSDKPVDPGMCIQVTVCGHDGQVYPSPCEAPSFPPPCYDYKTLGPQGSKSCICPENNPCPHGDPLTDASGSPLVCGRWGPLTSEHFDKCPSGSFCIQRYTAFDDPSFCCPYAPPKRKREGETCGECEDGLTCIKDELIPDAPGICTRSDLDNPCSYGSPLTDYSGVKLFCGRGPNTVECPKGSSCRIHNREGTFLVFFADLLHPGDFDQDAVCCPKVPKVTAVKKVSDGNRMFACSLYDSLAKKDVGKNLVMSPYSASSVMAMAYVGAAGDTYKQIKKGMYFPEMDILEVGYSDVIRELKGINHLDIANKMFIQNEFELLDTFQKSMKENFYSEVDQLDFSDSEAARNKINNWVGEETNGKIDNLIEKGLLSASTRMVLVNAIYFKGDWLHQFKKEDTSEKNFFVNNDKIVKVQMMHNQRAEFRISKRSDPAAYIIELPYRGERFSMYIVLPADKNGLEEVESKIGQKNIKQVLSITDSEKKMKLSFALPKFKVEKTIEMSEHFKKLGMSDMFDTKADFSGINGERDLYVTAAVQKTVLCVDELGSEAAAASAVMFRFMSSLPPRDSFELKCDHPFLFFIKDKQTDIILFRGRVMDPSSVSSYILG